MRETGFEPVSPETAVLKTAGITELTDSRETEIICHILFLLLLSHYSNKSNIYIMLHLLTHSKNSKNSERVYMQKKMSSVMPVGLSHLNCVNVFFFVSCYGFILFFIFLFFIGFFIFYWVFYFLLGFLFFIGFFIFY